MLYTILITTLCLDAEPFKKVDELYNQIQSDIELILALNTVNNKVSDAPNNRCYTSEVQWVEAN